MARYGIFLLVNSDELLVASLLPGWHGSLDWEDHNISFGKIIAPPLV